MNECFYYLHWISNIVVIVVLSFPIFWSQLSNQSLSALDRDLYLTWSVINLEWLLFLIMIPHDLTPAIHCDFQTSTTITMWFLSPSITPSLSNFLSWVDSCSSSWFHMTWLQSNSFHNKQNQTPNIRGWVGGEIQWTIPKAYLTKWIHYFKCLPFSRKNYATNLKIQLEPNLSLTVHDGFVFTASY